MWSVEVTDVFEKWYKGLSETERADVLAVIKLLEARGPMLSRPHADTVNDSQHSNMKELRVQSCGRPIRAFFAFDPRRHAILLCAGDKTGNKRFYTEMIPVADRLYDKHLNGLTK